MTTCLRCGFTPHVTAASWSFFLELEPPTQNRVASNKGGGRWTYKKLRDDYRWLVRAAKAREGVPDATGRRAVTLTRVYSGRQREFDYGNLVGGLKMVTDSLVRERLLVDDSPKWSEQVYLQRRGPVSGVEVRIEELT